MANKRGKFYRDGRRKPDYPPKKLPPEVEHLDQVESDRPDPFSSKADMKAYYIPYIDKGPQETRRRGESTMFRNFFDHRYFRESPIFKPTGPSVGFFQSSKYVTQFPWSCNNNFKPYRRPICRHSQCQFYTVRSRIVDYNLHNTNLRNWIPQWDI